MESLDAEACSMDNIFDFPSDIGEEDDDDDEEWEKTKIPRTSTSFSLIPSHSSDINPGFSEIVEEEELEWISNKDAFPMVESFADILPNHPSIASTTSTTYRTTTTNHRSPVSVLENSTSSTAVHGSSSNSNSHSNSHGSSSGNHLSCAVSSMISSFKVPGKARSKQRRKRSLQDMLGQQWQCWAQLKKVKANRPFKPSSTIGRKCLHCQADKTPQWRAGPLGPKTLCNACGVRYKSGRLVPEYRPASSPTFSTVLHSNSHRKIVEMRKQKIVTTNIGVKKEEIS